MNIITSKSNNVIKNAKKLHQKKYRTDSYLIEGWHLFEEALENQAIIRQVFVLEAYLDRVENIQNVTVVTSEILSLLIRTADAAGFDGVMLSKASADLYSLKTLRSMQGSHFHLPIWKMDREELFERASQSNLAVLATTLSEASIDYRQLPQIDQLILVMGNEGKGISPEMATRADQLVHITMPGRAESLNVAVAAGILMFSLRNF